MGVAERQLPNARFYVACTQMNDGDEPEDMAARLNSAELNVEMIQQMVIDNGGTTPVIPGRRHERVE